MAVLHDDPFLPAEISGACNTIVNEDGILTGYTTDGIGFREALKEEDRKSVV